MRIIGGMARGRRLSSPGSNRIRPTTDRAREALFNIVGPGVVDTVVLDLFAGTGALGLEAISRGAQKVVFVDSRDQAVNLIRRNIELCGFSNRSLVLQRDLACGLAFLSKTCPVAGFDLIFADPPYGFDLGGLILEGITEVGLVAPDGLIVVEDKAKTVLPTEVGNLRLSDQRQYGDTGFWFFRQG